MHTGNKQGATQAKVSAEMIIREEIKVAMLVSDEFDRALQF